MAMLVVDKLTEERIRAERERSRVDRRPWQLELLQRENVKLISSGMSTVATPNRLVSSVLPMAFRLIPGEERPSIEITHTETDERWIA